MFVAQNTPDRFLAFHVPVFSAVASVINLAFYGSAFWLLFRSIARALILPGPDAMRLELRVLFLAIGLLILWSLAAEILRHLHYLATVSVTILTLDGVAGTGHLRSRALTDRSDVRFDLEELQEASLLSDIHESGQQMSFAALIFKDGTQSEMPATFPDMQATGHTVGNINRWLAGPQREQAV